jgi:hypothetical protein
MKLARSVSRETKEKWVVSFISIVPKTWTNSLKLMYERKKKWIKTEFFCFFHIINHILFWQNTVCQKSYGSWVSKTCLIHWKKLWTITDIESTRIIQSIHIFYIESWDEKRELMIRSYRMTLPRGKQRKTVEKKVDENARNCFWLRDKNFSEDNFKTSTMHTCTIHSLLLSWQPINNF